MRILLAAQMLNDAQARRVADAAHGWATVTRPTASSSEFAQELRRADVLVGWGDAISIRDGRVITYLCGSAGYDAYIGYGLDIKPGFRFCSAGNVMGATIAEHCVAMMFALVRQIGTIIRQQQQHHWERRWNAGEVHGKKACVVGLGSTGTELTRRLVALGLDVSGVRDRAEHGHEIVQSVYPPEKIKEALAMADHVFNVLPGGPRTKHFFSADTFAAMKRGAFYYSASRGSVTDTGAVVDALADGQLAGAGLDVFAVEPLPPASPLWDMENVIVSPHSAGLSEYLNDRLTELFAENLHNVRDGKPLRNEINIQLLR